MKLRAALLALSASVLALLVTLPATQANAYEFAFADVHGRVGGHLLSTTMAGYSPKTATLPAEDLGIAVVRLRPVADVGVGDTLRFDFAWDVLPVVGSGAFVQRLAVAPPNRLRLWDFDMVAADGTSVDVQHNLDRLSLRLTAGDVDVRIGRQAIGHGGARLLPTADLFGPFGPGSIATAFKRGVDAIRFTAPFGDSVEVEAYAVAHRAALAGEANDVGLRDGIYALRLGLRVEGLLDASVIAGVSYRLPTLAFSLNGDVLGAGWYVEGSTRWDSDATGAFGEADGKLQLRTTAGLDRQWPSKLRTLLEVSYQSTGSDATGDDVALGMLAASARLPVVVGEAFLLGRLHAGAVVSREFWDLHNASVAAIWNLSDGSGFLMPSLALSISDEVGLAVGALLPVGKRPLVKFGDVPLPRSEFGSSPFLGYVDLRLGW